MANPTNDPSVPAFPKMMSLAEVKDVLNVGMPHHLRAAAQRRITGSTDRWTRLSGAYPKRTSRRTLTLPTG